MSWSNAIMRKWFNIFLWSSLMVIPLATISASELTGRFSMLGTTAKAKLGDSGYVDTDNHTLTGDQQSLRLMLEGSETNAEWSLHVKTRRQHVSGYSVNTITATDLFRYHDGSNDWLDESNVSETTRVGYEIDRAVYKRRFDNITLGIGRQPIDWGSGRFWQPLNVFGSFAPTDLDTDFKPGIDSAVLDWYPSAFSSLTTAYVLAPQDNEAIKNSAAIYYRRQVGDQSELSVLTGQVIDNTIFGGSFETSWRGIGWRFETAHYKLKQSDDTTVFWIAGLDYQFDDGTLLAIESYNNSHGASNESSLAAMQTQQLAVYGLQQQLSRQVLGVVVDRDITPLLHGSYTLLLSMLEDAADENTSSVLHQLSTVYSVSNESDLLVSILVANGKGLSPLNKPQSEFGHLPTSLTLRLRFYF